MMCEKKDMLIIQPVLTGYRITFFNELLMHFDSAVVMTNLQAKEGFQTSFEGLFTRNIHSPVFGKRTKFYYQQGVIKYILKNKPSFVFITADFRALHFWLSLIISKVLKIPTFSHGQALYNKPNPSLIQKLMFKIATSLSSQYICYTEFSKQTLLNIGINKNKLFVMDNTIVNKTPVTPVKKTQKTQRLFYLGRLREGCNLELLFSALSKLNQDGYALGVDILGDGTQRTELEKTAKSLNLDIKFYGAVYDDQTIADLSMNSTIGIYPGDAGLSIVHYMSLSLIPIVHEDVTKHMGPEPSYIINGENGITFKRNDSDSLALSIKQVIDNPEASKTIAQKAFETYESLANPTMAEKLISAMEPFLTGQSKK
jgi:glycosyltransferase involved in cell wall biosynthesis